MYAMLFLHRDCRQLIVLAGLYGSTFRLVQCVRRGTERAKESALSAQARLHTYIRRIHGNERDIATGTEATCVVNIGHRRAGEKHLSDIVWKTAGLEGDRLMLPVGQIPTGGMSPGH